MHEGFLDFKLVISLPNGATHTTPFQLYFKFVPELTSAADEVLYVHKVYNTNVRTSYTAVTCKYCTFSVESVASSYVSTSPTNALSNCFNLITDGDFEDIWEWNDSGHADCVNSKVVLQF